MQDRNISTALVPSTNHQSIIHVTERLAIYMNYSTKIYIEKNIYMFALGDTFDKKNSDYIQKNIYKQFDMKITILVYINN